VDTLDFFRELYGQCKDGWLTIWTLPDRRTQWFPVSKLEQATEVAKRLAAGGKDVYFGVGLRRKPVYKETEDGRRYLARGENEDVIAIPGLWIDIDIMSEAHKRKKLPPSLEDAISLLNFLPREPSILVDSGHGLHAYWLFEQPVYFDDAGRQHIERVISHWQRMIRDEATRRGWEIDNTADLARVLRVPGTTNYKIKDKPMPVQVIKVTEYAAEAV